MYGSCPGLNAAEAFQRASVDVQGREAWRERHEREGRPCGRGALNSVHVHV